MKQFTPPVIAKAFVLTSFLALPLLATAPAQAVVINFESLAVNNTSVNDAGATYTENGFTVTQVSQPSSLASFGTQDTRYPGSTALFNNLVGGITRLTQVGGGAFDLSSIDLTSLNGDDSVVVSFTGTKADLSTVSQSFTTDAVLSTLETFNFTNFTNLVSVDWLQNGSFHQFDNINVSAAGTTAVPEPFTILGTIFGVGSGVAMKRKLAKAQADKRSNG
jgi:hypothetical protein